MFGQSKTDTVKDRAAAASELAAALARDKRFRKQMIGAVQHGSRARRRAKKQIGVVAIAARLATDAELRAEVQQMTRDLQAALSRFQARRPKSHRLRNILLVAGIGGAAAVAFRKRGASTASFGGGASSHTIESSIEVAVPVSTAYNQWTQFEDFPLFMEGVDHVQQLDDTRLHWAVTIGGRSVEWDAKILEQHPDEQISWISEDGKKTRGTVTFEKLDESRTLVRLSMSYQAEGPVEKAGSALALDARRIRGDLERFKDLIESRGRESGAWRGEVEQGDVAR